MLNIISNPCVPEEIPKLKLSPHVNVSDAFRVEMDKWLLDTFGTHGVAYIINPSMLGLYGSSMMVINPKHLGIINMFTP